MGGFKGEGRVDLRVKGGCGRVDLRVKGGWI